MLRAIGLLALGCCGFAAACGSDSPSGLVESWPLTYDLTALTPPMMPGVQFSDPSVCGGSLAAEVERGTLTLNENGEATIEVDAWAQQPQYYNVPGFSNCTPTVTVLYSRPWDVGFFIDRAASQLTISFGGQPFAAASFGAGIPTVLSLDVTGWSKLGPAMPFQSLSHSTWTLRSQ